MVKGGVMMIGRITRWNDTRRALANGLREHGFDIWSRCSDRKENGRRRKWYICRRADRDGVNPLPMDLIEEERVMRVVRSHVPSAEVHSRTQLNLVVVWMENQQ